MALRSLKRPFSMFSTTCSEPIIRDPRARPRRREPRRRRSCIDATTRNRFADAKGASMGQGNRGSARDSSRNRERLALRMPLPQRPRLIAAGVAVLTVASLAPAGLSRSETSASRLPGAKAFSVCAAAGPFWPAQTLAIQGSTAWIACKERSRIVKFDIARGRAATGVRLDAPVIAVASGLGSTWALDTAATLYRVGPASSSRWE